MNSESISLGASWYRNAIQGRTRMALAWLFVLILGFAARDYPRWHGILLCFAGATLRFWASGHLRKNAAPAVSGPYALVRNPLYLGTYLMAVGTVLSIENWWLLALVTFAFAAVYHYVILDEETKLLKILGAPYAAYRGSVPRFFPKLWPRLFSGSGNPSQSRFSFALAWKNKAYEAYLSFAGLIGFVAFVAYVWKNMA